MESNKLTSEQSRRLTDLGEKMKTATGDELDAIVAEVDKIIGYEEVQQQEELRDEEEQ